MDYFSGAAEPKAFQAATLQLTCPGIQTHMSSDAESHQMYNDEQCTQ